MSPRSKKEYLEALFPRYKKTRSKEQKTEILNEFCKVCGYHRKHAIRLLGKFRRFIKPKIRKRGKPSTYNQPPILAALEHIWLASGMPCSKRLVIIIPLWLPHYPGGLDLPVIKAVEKISAPSIDRVLKHSRKKYKRVNISTTKPGTLLRKQIPIKTNQWDEFTPGFLEADTVAHCGGSTAGDYVNTVNFVDIATGWTEQRAVFGKGETGVLDQIKDVEPELTVNKHILKLGIFHMPTENSYNRVLELLASLTSLLVNLLKYAQRHPKNTSFRRRFESDSLWRHGTFSTVLSKTGFEAIPAELHSLGTPRQSISSGPIDFDYHLYDGCRDEAYFGHQNLALQRILSSPAGVERLSRQFDFERIPEEFDGSRDRRLEEAARFVAQYDLQNDRGFQQHGSGFGLDRSAFVRLENSRSQNRLQSQEAGTPELSSLALLRRTHADSLARSFETRQHARYNRSRSVLQGVLEEDASLPLPNSPAGRRRVLRPCFDRNARRGKDRLRDCR